MEPIKVLVVDDSSLVRKILKDALEKDPAIEVVGTANNGKSAIYKSEVLDPDVITMDIEMPIMNGLDALKEIMRSNPKPVIMMSVLTHHGAVETIQALEYGAVDFVPKPSTILNMSVEEIYDLLITKVKSVYKLKFKVEGKKTLDDSSGKQKKQRYIKRPASKIVKPISAEFTKTAKKIIGIGTSTGGPSALLSVFQMLPQNLPVPIVVVQHMPVGFTEAFAERLHNTSQLNVKEAEDGDRLLPGHAYIARGDSQLAVSKQKEGDFLKVYAGQKVSGHCPSIDVLFDSMAQAYTTENIAAIMTGMGKDGAQGILNIKNSGGYTIAQNEDTSIVYGMNRVAVELGAIHDEVPLLDIAKKIVEHIG